MRGPEKTIQLAIKAMLEAKGWTVKETHGNTFQQGLPDLYCIHPDHQQRWIEVKNPKRYKFTAAQREFFPVLNKCVGLWILVAATNDEYKKLFGPPNWYHYLK